MITRLINIFHWLRPSQLEGIHVHPEIKNVNLFPCMVMFKGVCLKNRNVVFTKLGETLSYTKLYSKHLEKNVCTLQVLYKKQESSLCRHCPMTSQPEVVAEVCASFPPEKKSKCRTHAKLLNSYIFTKMVIWHYNMISVM